MDTLMFVCIDDINFRGCLTTPTTPSIIMTQEQEREKSRTF
jgi:hypothetical protein